jgi:hypothetical protein
MTACLLISLGILVFACLPFQKVEDGGGIDRELG